MTLFDAAERFAAMDRSQVSLDPGRCLHSLDQNSDCTACLGLCPENAILEGKPPSLNVDACRACLACLPACPVGAYHADDAVTALLNCAARVEAGTAVELICALHPHPETGAAEGLGIRVPGCLAGLGAGALVLLSSLGLEKVSLRLDACKECRWAGLQTRAEHQVSQARLFLAAWGRSSQLACSIEREGLVERPLWDSKNPPMSRRDMFRLVALQGKIAMARAMEKDQAAKEKNPGRDRMRLLTAIQHLPAPSADKVPLETLAFALPVVSEECTACGVCARACPTEALAFEKNAEGTTFTLKLDPRNCIGCDICENVCAPSAVHVNHHPLFGEVFGAGTVTLQEGELVKCQNCGTLIAKRGGSKLCALCAYRREHPFGSVMPPGMKLASRKRKGEGNP